MPSCSLSSCHSSTCTILIVLVAELKERASKAKDTSVTKIQNTCDQHSRFVLLSSINITELLISSLQCSFEKHKLGSLQRKTFASTASRTDQYIKTAMKSFPTSTCTAAQQAGSVVSSSSTSLLSSGPPPPPVKRATRPLISSSGSAPGPPLLQRSMSLTTYASQEPELDWRNLSQQDKEVFFSWLDEFFEHSYGIAT